MAEKPKNNINDYKNRMTSPVGIVVTTKKSKPKTVKKKGK